MPKRKTPLNLFSFLIIVMALLIFLGSQLPQAWRLESCAFVFNFWSSWCFAPSWIRCTAWSIRFCLSLRAVLVSLLTHWLSWSHFVRSWGCLLPCWARFPIRAGAGLGCFWGFSGLSSAWLSSRSFHRSSRSALPCCCRSSANIFLTRPCKPILGTESLMSGAAQRLLLRRERGPWRSWSAFRWWDGSLPASAGTLPSHFWQG